MTTHHKIIIVGAGPAGYTAAIYAARANLNPLLIMGPLPGGQLMITTDVENYPGFQNGIMGPKLMEDMRLQAQHVGTEMQNDIVTHVNFKASPLELFMESGQKYTADSIVIATGAQARWLGLPSEEYFRGFGVSACATCDGFFFKNVPVAVIGGGNSAVEEALFLTHFASEVTIIHRRDKFRAEKIAQDRLFAHPKIKVLWNYEVESIIGVENPRAVKQLKLKHTSDGSLHTLDVEGVFVAIGHVPMTKPFEGEVAMDAEGYIVADVGTTRTSAPGVFAAGDVRDKVFRQAITAAGQGCMAALEAEKYLVTKGVIA